MPLEIETSAAGVKVVAMWPDGDWKLFENIKPDTLRQMQAARRQHSEAHRALWAAAHCKTHNKLTLAQRVDRGLLLSLDDQTKQVCQWRVDRHGKLPKEQQQPSLVDNNDPAVQACAAFAVPECKLYASYKLSQRSIKVARNKRDEKIRKVQVRGGQPRTAAERAARRESGMSLSPHAVKMKKQEEEDDELEARG